jgi:hypothetical protein
MAITITRLFAAITELYRIKTLNARPQQPLSVDSLALYMHCSCEDILYYAGLLEAEGKITILDARAQVTTSRQRRRPGIAQIVLR